VQSGEVDVAGSVLSASSGPVQLCCDDHNGCALAIDVVSTEATVPLAGPGGVALSIASCPPGSGVDRRGRSFDVFLDGDPAAPAVLEEPRAWRDAAAQLAASVAGGAEAGAPPAVLAVCGAKNVGKSSFARLLVNVLLNSHPCVAFLDTGG
jgi:polynucleotide 5'-hydroxyl-kinase GRC3/NOL9